MNKSSRAIKMLSSLFNKENKRKEMRNKKSLIISGKKHKKKLSLQNNKDVSKMKNKRKSKDSDNYKKKPQIDRPSLML